MPIGVVTDLTAKAMAASKEYAAQLQTNTRETVSSALDLETPEEKMATYSASEAYKVDLSLAAMQKAMNSR